MDLIEANNLDIEFLRDETRKHLPTSLTIHGLLEVGYRFEVVNTNQTKLFIPQNKTLPLFIFAIQIADVEIQSANCFWDESGYSEDQLKKLLQRVPDWDWTKPIYFEACPIPMLKKLETLLLGPDGLTKGMTTLTRFNDGFAYRPIKRNNDPQRFSTLVYRMDSVDSSRADHVHKHWIHNFEGSVNSIKRALSLLPSAGIYLKDQNGDDLLVSWTAVKKNGEIGWTSTLPEFRNLGFASEITKFLVNICIEKKIFHYILVASNSVASIKFHNKLGYEKEGHFGWCHYISEDRVEKYNEDIETHIKKHLAR